MSIITVNKLEKVFKVHKKEPGFGGSLKSLFFRKYEKKHAVKNVSFEIAEGELIGFIGPNGAGKTTTLKCLSGLLYPSAGEVSVLGYKPFERKPEFLKQISLVMGQKNQLWWDLPAADTFLLNKEIYDISDKDYQERLHELVKLMEVEDALKTPVRSLSLGQRMKCELIAALLHKPKVLFLDEPTIGLDVVMQQNLRQFVKEYNKRYRATIILTSHYMEDVKELCERVIVIDHGSLLFDGKLSDIIRQYADYKVLSVVFDQEVEMSKLTQFGNVQEANGTKVAIAVKTERANQVAATLLNDFPVDDLNIQEPKIEEVIRKVFGKV